MPSTATLAVASGCAAAAVTFAAITILGADSQRPDLGGPVVVQPASGIGGPSDQLPTPGGGLTVQ